MAYRIDPYDDTTQQGILSHAEKLLGKTFAQVIEYATNGELSAKQVMSGILDERWQSYANKARKGGLGDLLEEVFFGYAPNSSPEPDFVEAGVELKTTPYEVTKKGEKRAGERLVLTMIPHDKPVEEPFEESHLWQKCRTLLIIYYLRTRGLHNFLYSIDFVNLFTPPKEDLAIIRKDYEYITSMIRQGKAHELSERDTVYLGACTKGATAESSLKPQYYAPSIPAKTRAWCYKQPYMTVLLQGFSTGKHSHGRIFNEKRGSLLNRFSFGRALEILMRTFIGDTVDSICSKVGLKKSTAKNFHNMLAVRMLGVGQDYAEEFIKAGIKVKAIRIEQDGSMREHFRLFDVDFEEHDKAPSFEGSELHRFLSNTSMYILVFKSNGEEYLFQGAFLWHIPDKDLLVVEREFSEARDIIRHGIQFKISGGQVLNNLPKPEPDGISHLRTHASQTYYMFADGRGNVGKGSVSNTTPVPHTGHRCTKHSYWLNKWYMLRQIERGLNPISESDR